MHTAGTDDYLTARTVINSRGIKSRIQRLLSAAIQRFLYSRRGTVRNLGRYIYILESRGFADDFASSGEPEGLHLIGVLTIGDEYREDVAFGGIQQKFREGLA
jgi:hypothetical protein